jgi:hypothetical protein
VTGQAAELTQAEKWAGLYADRTSGLIEVNAQRLLAELAVDFPHQIIKLTDNGRLVGCRRVFGDRSYADAMIADVWSMSISCGTMSAGMLGIAANDRIIE